MNVAEFVATLEAYPDVHLSMVLPNGVEVPKHFHITEVGRLEKQFIDCGGTKRTTVACVLQAWTANDLDHRLTAGKLAKIIRMADDLLGSASLNMELEYGTEVISHYFIDTLAFENDSLRVSLVGKQTACLALDKCLVIASCDASEGCCS